MNNIALSNGTILSLDTEGANVLVLLDHPDAPEDMRNVEAGRIIGGHFQPMPFVNFGMSPEALRAIADLVETQFTPEARAAALAEAEQNPDPEQRAALQSRINSFFDAQEAQP
jgi:hypothetical protein